MAAQRIESPQARIERVRGELLVVLDAIDDKLDVPKQARALGRRLRRSVRTNPAPWLAGAVGAAVLIAGGIALAVRRAR